MAKPVRFPDQSHVFRPPQSMEEGECGELPAIACVLGDNVTYMSCWKLTPEELEEVQRTGVVWIGAVSMQPPLIVAGIKPFKSMSDTDHN